MTPLQSHEAPLYPEVALSGVAVSPLRSSEGHQLHSESRPAGKALLTSKEARVFLGISPATLSRATNGKLRNATKLRVIRMGRKHFYRLEALTEWLLENES